MEKKKDTDRMDRITNRIRYGKPLYTAIKMRVDRCRKRQTGIHVPGVYPFAFCLKYPGICGSSLGSTSRELEAIEAWRQRCK